MTTKELIDLLKENDPDGNTEVCIGNEAIIDVSREPAYYDGPLQIMLRDSTKDCYNVTGFKITHHGDKVSIFNHSIREALFNNVDLPVETETERDKERVEQWREDAKESHRQIAEYRKSQEK